MSNILKSTEFITVNSEYIDNSSDFFSHFKPCWKSVVSQVLKLETRQAYQEKGNPSFELLSEGKFQKAIDLIPKVRAVDLELYRDLSERKVEFIRCRPVSYPLTEYLRWEFEVYKYNSSKGEKIFCVERNSLSDLFDNLALHDFMIFDNENAFIHNYDAEGQIQGGWIINNDKYIQNLIQLYSIIRAASKDFSFFMP